MGRLGDQFTVVAPDLRGYGHSGLSATGYDKRSTASDLHELIGVLGWTEASVAGHDRGARVAHRWALDHPEDIRRLALLDILPTREVVRGTDLDSAKRLWHWFFHLQPGLPEVLLAGRTDDYVLSFLRESVRSGAIDSNTLEEYLWAFRRRDHLAASLEDYRASFGRDLELDDLDFAEDRRISGPLLLLWGANGGLAADDVPARWSRYADDVRGSPIEGSGHFIPEEQPNAVVTALREFFTVTY